MVIELWHSVLNTQYQFFWILWHFIQHLLQDHYRTLCLAELMHQPPSLYTARLQAASFTQIAIYMAPPEVVQCITP